MLRGIQKASGSWLGKAVLTVVMGLLVVSFAIWGIGDIFRGFGRSTVLKIGGTEVTIEQFRNYYTDKMNQLGRRFGRPVTPDQARALGLDRQLVGQYVAEAVLDEQAHKLGLGISDAELVRKIMADPAFRSLNGQFDRARFEQTIRQAGFSEANYVNEQRRLTIRRQIALSVSGEIVPPAAAVNSVFQFQNEKRSAELIALGPAQAGEIPAPDAEALKKYFDERQVMFRAPETRKVTLLPLTPAEIARWTTIADADARKYYDENKYEFGSPERRELKQIVFAKAEDARAASERIKGGLSFADLAKERGLKDSDVDLGTVAKSAVIDPAVAEAAFVLKPGEVSAPVQGRFGTVLIQAIKIEPGAQKSFESVAADIKRRIAETRARTEIGTLRDKIEDERAGGSTLAEAAKKLGLTTRTIEAIDRSGRDTGGEPVKDLPQGADVVRAVFATDVGVETDPLPLPGGGYLWYDVAGVTPSRDRALDEVKGQVEQRWRDDEIAKRLKTRADEMVGKLKGGATLSQLAAEAGLKVESASQLQRGKSAPNVPAPATQEIFRTAKGGAGSSEGDKAAERVVFVVTDIAGSAPDPNSADAKRIAEALKNGIGEDILSQYVAQLEKDIGVTINEQALGQVTGAAAN